MIRYGRRFSVTRSARSESLETSPDSKQSRSVTRPEGESLETSPDSSESPETSPDSVDIKMSQLKRPLTQRFKVVYVV